MKVAGLPDAALGHLLCSMADDELVIGFSDLIGTGIAPSPEEDVALISLARDEIGHAAALFGLLGELTGGDPDLIAYDREPVEYRHCRLLDHGRGDWSIVVARRYLYETSEVVRLEALADGAWAPLADLAATLALEEHYQLMHVQAWLGRLADTSGASRDRLLAALQLLATDAGTVFTPLPGESALIDAGILASPMTDLEARWRASIAQTFEVHRLPMPPVAKDPERGRQDHGSDFAWLWGEFNAVRRSDPGVTW